MASNNVIPFPTPDRKARQIAELAKLPLSTLYRLRLLAIDESDAAWVAILEEAAMKVYGR